MPTPRPRRSLMPPSEPERSNPHLTSATLRLTDEDIDKAVASEVASRVLVATMQAQLKSLQARVDENNHLSDKIADVGTRVERKVADTGAGLDTKIERNHKVVEGLVATVQDHQRLFDEVDLRGLSTNERRSVPKTLRMGIGIEKFTRGFRGMVVLLGGGVIAIGAMVQIIQTVVDSLPKK
jgi:hypothetical protein